MASSWCPSMKLMGTLGRGGMVFGGKITFIMQLKQMTTERLTQRNIFLLVNNPPD